MTPPGRYTLLQYDYVADLLERRVPHRDGHLALIHAWKDEGRLLLAGPLGDPPHGGLFLLRDKDDAQAFVDADPYVHAGLVTDWRAEPIVLV